jgi:hypothetical protein
MAEDYIMRLVQQISAMMAAINITPGVRVVES